MTGWIGNSMFIAQILCGELIFLYSYPKRKHFFLRLFGSMALLLLLFYFFPTIRGDQFFAFFKYNLMFASTVAGMYFCFDVKIIALISACVAGYAVQHIAYQITQMVALAPLLKDFSHNLITRNHLLELMVFPVVYAVCIVTFGRISRNNELYKNYSLPLVLISIFTVFICLGISRFARAGYNDGNVFNTVAIALYACSSCFFSLIVQYNLHSMFSLRAKNEMLERISYEERKQYEVSKQNHELLNIKMHDIKHVLHLLEGNSPEEAAVFRKLIEEYDGVVRTYNETIDLIVNEKAALCRKEGITLTCLGDGRLLSFVNQYDAYSLLGNILENAIEAVRKIDEPNKRIVSITIEARGDFVFVNALNYYADQFMMDNGLPRTTKTAEQHTHGFGVKSIKLIAQKYGGDINIAADGEVFELSVFLIAPKAEQPE